MLEDENGVELWGWALKSTSPHWKWSIGGRWELGTPWCRWLQAAGRNYGSCQSWAEPQGAWAEQNEPALWYMLSGSLLMVYSNHLSSVKRNRLSERRYKINTAVERRGECGSDDWFLPRAIGHWVVGLLARSWENTLCTVSVRQSSESRGYRVFWDRVSLCTLGWLGTHDTDHTGIQLMDVSVSAS